MQPVPSTYPLAFPGGDCGSELIPGYESVAWFTFVIQAGTNSFEWQVIETGTDEVFYEFYVSNDYGGPDECTDLTYYECGYGFNSWELLGFPAPDLTKPSRIYLATYSALPDDEVYMNLKIRKACGEACADSDINVTVDDACLSLGNSTTLTAVPSGGSGGPYTYFWSPDDGTISPIDVANPTVTPITTTTYSVLVIGADGCPAMADATVTVKDFLVVCPTFPNNPTELQCMSAIPTATTLTEAQFEALGNGDGDISDDRCGLVVITAGNVGDMTCEGSIIRNYYVKEYRDDNNNGILDPDETTLLRSVTCSQNFLVEYADFTMPPDSGTDVNCPDATDTAPTLPIVMDNCGVTLTPSSPTISAKPNCDGTRTYTYTYTDCEGNSHDWVYTYTVTYTGALTAPANGNSNANCPAEAIDPGAPATIKDACNNDVVPTLVGNSGTDICNGTIVWTYRYEACSGQTADWTFTYTVDMPDNLMAPTNGTDIVACLSDATDPGPPVNILDACNTSITPVLIGFDDTPNSITCEGQRVWTYRYTDCANHTADWTFTYTIEVEDFTAPANSGTTVSCPDDTDTAPMLPSVSDNCGTSLSPDGPPVISTKPTCEGTRTYTYTFTDCEGNSHDWVYTYTIEYEDFTMPPNGSTTVSCPDDTDTAPSLPSVKDNCGITLTPSAPVISTKPTCEGTRTYTYTYTDCEGNSHDWVYTYAVEYEDFTMPSNGGTTVSCPDDTDTAPSLPSVKDNCGITLAPSAPVISTKPTCEGTRTYTYTYTDCENNSHEWVYTYTVDYDEFTLPPNGSSTATCVDNIVMPSPPTVYDACGGTTTIGAATTSDNPPGLTCAGTRTYTWPYTDCAGQTQNWSHIVTIDDDIIPEFTNCPVVPYYFCATEPFVYDTPIAIDNCRTPDVTLTSGPASGTKGLAPGTYTITFHAEDNCNNLSMACSFDAVVLTPIIATGGSEFCNPDSEITYQFTINGGMPVQDGSEYTVAASTIGNTGNPQLNMTSGGIGDVFELTLDASTPFGTVVYIEISDTEGCSITHTYTTSFQCCIADISILVNDDLCPNEDLVINIPHYQEYDEYSTFIIITDMDNMITDLIDVSENLPVGVVGQVSNKSSEPIINGTSYTLGYDFWGIAPGDAAQDKIIYTYNEHDNNQPNTRPVLFGYIDEIGLIEEGCYMLSEGRQVHIPAPYHIIGDGANDFEGDEGGTSPFYYNHHTIIFEGGTGPYNYQWETDGYVRHAIVGTGHISIIYADNAVWYVTVTDSRGCTDEILIFTNDPEEVGGDEAVLDIYKFNVNAETNGGDNGSIEIWVEGGSGDNNGEYYYFWYGPLYDDIMEQGPSTSENYYKISNLSAGWYHVKVIDDLNGNQQYDEGTDEQITEGWYWVANVEGSTEGGGAGIRGKINPQNDGPVSVLIEPNPVNDFFNIHFVSAMDRSINLRLFDMQGKEVRRYNNIRVSSNIENQWKVNTDELPVGIYLLRISDQNGESLYTRKIIKN